MNYLQKAQALIVATMEDDLPANLLLMADEVGGSLLRPKVKEGFVDPFNSIDKFPALHVYGIGRGEVDRTAKMVTIRCQVLMAVQDKDPAKKINGSLDAIAKTLEALPGGDIYDVQGITLDIYYGPSDVKQTAVGTINFDVLLNL